MSSEIKKITEDMAKALRNPLPPTAIKPHPTQSHLSTIKPIYVIERLNTVFGIGVWKLKTELLRLNEGTTKSGKAEFTSLVKTILEIPDYGVYYECIAGSTNIDMGDATKGGTTDAITKIGSYLEIGIDVFKGNPNAKPNQNQQRNNAANQPPTAQPTSGKIQKEGLSDNLETYISETAPKEAEPKQKEQIIKLLNNPVINAEEKNKMLLSINSLTEERAKQAIAKLKKTIEERENYKPEIEFAVIDDGQN